MINIISFFGYILTTLSFFAICQSLCNLLNLYNQGKKSLQRNVCDLVSMSTTKCTFVKQQDAKNTLLHIFQKNVSVRQKKRTNLILCELVIVLKLNSITDTFSESAAPQKKVRLTNYHSNIANIRGKNSFSISFANFKKKSFFF
ncbi:hypothetical protein RFI_19320 [Reticulomyxa filosa]|uniref:Transmembrane protein n=1 Tax=Reticulomyxa filosa TaxID=46433 RepID=X6MVH0_RETFI|nr:hypothetical protein RFI_19320 [Reticulomyxa filosa]|eukprot:ETO17983.1 hypothetical protein RFI_19320 [Reticulomyxa filosa]